MTLTPEQAADRIAELERQVAAAVEAMQAMNAENEKVYGFLLHARDYVEAYSCATDSAYKILNPLNKGFWGPIADKLKTVLDTIKLTARQHDKAIRREGAEIVMNNLTSLLRDSKHICLAAGNEQEGVQLEPHNCTACLCVALALFPEQFTTPEPKEGGAE